jgi:esterase
MRNHMSSNHHDDMNYNVMSEDVIRFADKHQIDKFTVLGHSLGGKTAMTVACRFPDRVDGCISVDAAPVDESKNPEFRTFTWSVVSLTFITLSG